MGHLTAIFAWSNGDGVRLRTHGQRLGVQASVRIMYSLDNGWTDLMKCNEGHPMLDAISRGDRVK